MSILVLPENQFDGTLLVVSVKIFVGSFIVGSFLRGDLFEKCELSQTKPLFIQHLINAPTSRSGLIRVV